MKKLILMVTLIAAIFAFQGCKKDGAAVRNTPAGQAKKLATAPDTSGNISGGQDGPINPHKP